VKECLFSNQEAAYDAELRAGLEVQKRLREQILRRKEMRRQMQAKQRKAELESQLATSQGQIISFICLRLSILRIFYSFGLCSLFNLSYQAIANEFDRLLS